VQSFCETFGNYIALILERNCWNSYE